MSRWDLLPVGAAGILGASGVVIGAAGSHLGGGDLARLSSEFLLFHAAAIPGIMAFAGAGSALARVVATTMVVGATCFSGGLAVLAFAGTTPVSGLTPFGGLLLIAGWLLLVVLAVTGRRRRGETRV